MSTNSGIDFSPIIKEIDKIEKKIDQYVELVLFDGQKILLGEIQSKAPKKTGDYASSWKLGDISEDKAIVFTPLGKLYAILEFQGAKAGTRTPKNAKAIRFETADGTIVFTMKVKFPGFSAIPHVRPAMKKVIDLMPEIMYSRLDELSKFFKKS